MTTLSRRALLSATGAVSLTAILAACADTGADGQAVSGGGDADYDTVINSGPVAAADVVAASRAREVHMRAPAACGTDQEEVERIVAALH